MTYTLDDVLKCYENYMLADCIWREARGESFRGMVMVGEVLRARKADPRWPNTYDEVALQPKQFSAYNAGDPNGLVRPHRTVSSFVACCRAAVEALNGSSYAASANHYLTRKRAEKSPPLWFKADSVVATEGNHVFLKL